MKFPTGRSQWTTKLFPPEHRIATERIWRSEPSPGAMSLHQIRLDLSLVRQGVTIGYQFGVRSIEELGRIAELVERSVYERHSLTRTPEGLRFTLLNPPLRMGAFSSLGLLLDGVPLPPERSWVRTGREDRRSFSSVDRDHPVTLPIGSRTTIEAEVSPSANKGAIRVRLDLRSVAIPPRVWFEFTDEPHEAAGVP